MIFKRTNKRRLNMIKDIKDEAQLTRGYTHYESFDSRILNVMESVPRHEFVPNGMRNSAYENRPIYIGFGQTISQPYIVALMTQLVAPREKDVMLDVGTGSGYQAAVLSRLVEKVYSVEIISELALKARKRLQRLGYKNVEVAVCNGYDGWEEFAPYNGIVVAAATPVVPLKLIAQLAEGGRLVMPLGTPPYAQELVVITKEEGGKVSMQSVLPVSFVPMVDNSH